MSALKDSWFQLLAFLVLVSGALTAHGMMTGLYQPGMPESAVQGLATAPPSPAAVDRIQTFAPGSTPPSPVPEEPSSGGPSLEDVLSGRSPAGSAPVPAGPPAQVNLTGVGAVRVLPKSKKPGQWVVDAKLGADADTKSLSEALASAKDGDLVLLRPGTYAEAVTIDKSLTVQGSGAAPGDAVIRGSAAQTLASSGAKVLLKNLTIQHSGPQYSKAMRASGGELRLEGVRVLASAESAGLEIEQARVTAQGFSIEGAYAGVVLGAGAWAKLSLLSVRDAKGFAVGLTRGAELQLDKGSLLGSGSFGLLIRNGRAEVTDTLIASGKECGVGIEGGTAVLRGVKVNRNLCGVRFLAGGELESNNGDFKDNTQGPLAYNGAFRALIKLSGAGNKPALALPDMPGFVAPGAQQIVNPLGVNPIGAIPQAAGAAPQAPQGRSRFGNWDIFTGANMQQFHSPNNSRNKRRR